MTRRIAVVTGTRAEYGLLEPVVAEIRRDRALRLQLLVTGTHLSRAHGLTVREIERDGHPIAARVPLPLKDTPAGIAESMSAAVKGLSRAFARLRPDLLVLLGDRWEALAAACAALPFGLPVAHLHGGEASEGVWDESARHAITKLSHLHFAAAEPYARRLRQLGEDPRRVFPFGSPSLDRARSVERLSRGALERELGLPLDKPLGVVTFHPETLRADRGLPGLDALLAAIARRPGSWVFTAPNADLGGTAVSGRLRSFLRGRPHAKLVASLGQRRYFSLLAQADVMCGNSSSGLLEAPYFGLPVVNIGDRQKGRLRQANVVDVPRPTAAAVERALAKALSPAFRARLPRTIISGPSPSRRIVSVLKSVRLEGLTTKEFHDL